MEYNSVVPEVLQLEALHLTGDLVDIALLFENAERENKDGIFRGDEPMVATLVYVDDGIAKRWRGHSHNLPQHPELRRDLSTQPKTSRNFLDPRTDESCLVPS